MKSHHNPTPRRCAIEQHRGTPVHQLILINQLRLRVLRIGWPPPATQLIPILNQRIPPMLGAEDEGDNFAVRHQSANRLIPSGVTKHSAYWLPRFGDIVLGGVTQT